MSQLTTVDNAKIVEDKARYLAGRADAPFVLAAALMINLLQDADVDDLGGLASGDDDLTRLFFDRNAIGDYVAEHCLPTIQEIAADELAYRSEAAESAYDVEMGLREREAAEDQS